MIRFAKPTAFVLCALLGPMAAGPAMAQQGSASDKAAQVKKKPAKPTAPSAAADKGKAADKSADAGAGKPLLVASFGDWGVYQTQAAKGRVCYTLAQPKDRAPGDLKRDPAYAFISDRPGEGVRNEISFIMGFDVANPPEAAAADPKKPAADPKKNPIAKEAMAIVGDQSFELLAKTTNLWVKNAAKEGQLIDEMRKGAKLQVMAASMKGHMTTDTYSLAGFSQALDRVQKDCPSK
jgi:hypothetical protein